MGQIGRLEFVVQDSAGNAIPSASVEVRRQGAQINGFQAGPGLTTINVDAPGGVIAGDTVKVNTTGATRTVSSITSITVVVGAPGFGSVNDDDRITIVSSLPTIYEDAEGSVSTANPMTTNSLGRCGCYATGGKYDVLISGGGLTDTLLVDQIASGGDRTISNVFYTGAGVSTRVADTLRACGANDKLVELKTAGTTRFELRGDGEIIAGSAGAAHTLTGSLTTSAGLINTASGITNTGNIVSSSGNITVSSPGDIDQRRILASKGTAIVAGDVGLSGWGAGASVFIQAGSNDVRGAIQITAGAGAVDGATATLTFKDGAYATGVRFYVCTRADGTAPTGAYFKSAIGGSTTLAVSWISTGGGAPTNGNIYTFTYVCIG